MCEVQPVDCQSVVGYVPRSYIQCVKQYDSRPHIIVNVAFWVDFVSEIIRLAKYEKMNARHE